MHGAGDRPPGLVARVAAAGALVSAGNIVPMGQERSESCERAELSKLVEQCSEHFLGMFQTCGRDQHAQALTLAHSSSAHACSAFSS